MNKEEPKSALSGPVEPLSKEDVREYFIRKPNINPWLEGEPTDGDEEIEYWWVQYTPSTKNARGIDIFIEDDRVYVSLMGLEDFPEDAMNHVVQKLSQKYKLRVGCDYGLIASFSIQELDKGYQAALDAGNILGQPELHRIQNEAEERVRVYTKQQLSAATKKMKATIDNLMD